MYFLETYKQISTFIRCLILLAVWILSGHVTTPPAFQWPPNQHNVEEVEEVEEEEDDDNDNEEGDDACHHVPSISMASQPAQSNNFTSQ